MSTVERHLGRRFGFSCQAWLAVDIADRFFGAIYRTWFSTAINPQHNGHSSNPLHLFQELDRIVAVNDHNHSRVAQLRVRLSNWIAGSALSPPDIAALIGEIISAPVPAFRPQLWKVDLGAIHVSRLVSLGQFPDEYQVADLIKSEIEVVVP